MKKSVLISLIALGVSLVGLVIALAAWMRKKKNSAVTILTMTF